MIHFRKRPESSLGRGQLRATRSRPFHIWGACPDPLPASAEREGMLLNAMAALMPHWEDQSARAGKPGVKGPWNDRRFPSPGVKQMP